MLSAADAYYMPIFVESLGYAANAQATRAGCLFVDFVLDMKGEGAVAASYESALASWRGAADADGGAEGAAGGANETTISLLILVNGEMQELVFETAAPAAELAARAEAFAATHRLDLGTGCDDHACVIDYLTAAMRFRRDELMRARADGRDTAARDADDLPRRRRYEGYIDAALEEGRIDIGAFAFRTDVGARIGYRWRHHAADWAFIDAYSKAMEAVGMYPYKIPHTLYVHN